MKILIFAVITLVATAQPTRDWSKIKPKHVYVQPKVPAIAPKIVGGLEAEPHGVPHQAAVIGDSGSFCGGSIISEDAVLTAAHCVDDRKPVDVILSAHKILENESEQQVIRSIDVRVHPDWDPYKIVNDIAIIRLVEKIRIDRTATIVTLNKETASLQGEEALVSGWGLDSDSATSISPVLRYTTSDIISNIDCEKFFGSYVTRTNICLNGASGKGACSGDSGGPLFISRNDQPVQAGIVSFGSSAGCEKGYPSVFTRVSEYQDWINQQLL